MYTEADIRQQCASTIVYSRGMELYRRGSAVLEESYEEEEFLTLEGSVTGSRGFPYEVKIEYDLELDEIAYWYCDCPAFDAYPGICKHCVAFGRQVLDEIEKSGKNGIPLIRARKVRTDYRLEQMMKGYAVRRRMREEKAEGEIELIPKLCRESYRFYASTSWYVTFKVGGSRKYVVKNLREFAEAVLEEKTLTYGKGLSFIPVKSMFTPDSWKYVEFILSNVDNLNPYERSVVKELRLDEEMLGYFWRISLGKTVEYEGPGTRGGELHIVEADPPQKIVLREQGEGDFVLKLPRIEWYDTSYGAFVCKGSSVYRCTEAFREHMGMLMQLAEQCDGEELSLSGEDMQAFCATILPEIETVQKLDKGKLDLDAYLPQEARFCFYLDEENGKVLLKAEAVYREQRHNLLTPPEYAESYRDAGKERRVLEQAEAYFPQKIGEYLYFDSDDHDRMYRLMDTGVDQLEKLGEVYLSEQMRMKKIIRSPQAQVGVQLKSGLLELTVESEEFEKSDLAGIVDAYRRKKKYYRLKNGDFLNLEENAASSVADLLDGLDLKGKELAEDVLILPKFQACFVDQVLQEAKGAVRTERNPDYKALIRNMKNVEDSDFPVPAQLSGILRSYQKNGFRWLCTLAELGFGGILADDMGLGKTIQTIACLQYRKEKGCGRSLIVCPASLVYNWKKELEKFAPDLRVRLLVGTAAEREAMLKSAAAKGQAAENPAVKQEQTAESAAVKEQAAESPAAKGQAAENPAVQETGDDVWVTSYDLLKRDLALYRDLQFDLEVLDEAQNIKNQGTQAAKSVKQIRANVHFALTGTPIENRLSELWSIFDYLMPGMLKSYEAFRKKYETPIVQNQDPQALASLKKIITPFLLRRVKQDVAKELPEKLEQTVYAKMGEEQRKLYVAAAGKLAESLKEQSKEAFRSQKLQILAELTRLRQLCCDPGLLYENFAEDSCKVETCMELVKEAVEGGHKTLIFSQFTSIFPILQKKLEQEHIACYVLTGETSKEKRMELAEAFQEDDTPVFLISLKAGGTGLNLTAASVVIHFDPWWNQAAQNQATDRTHRIGQREQVVVFKLIAQDTLEEKILDLQEQKRQLADQFLEGEGISASSLSKEDLMEILRV